MTDKREICRECHVAILEPHPEDKFRDLEFFKCPICGNTKIILNTSIKNNIIYGRDKE